MRRDADIGTATRLIISVIRKQLSSPLPKNILVFGICKSVYKRNRPVPPKGRLEIVADAGQDAVDAGGARNEGACLRTAKSCGSDASVLASSPWEVKTSRGRR